jgi:hypothetical protein
MNYPLLATVVLCSLFAGYGTSSREFSTSENITFGAYDISGSSPSTPSSANTAAKTAVYETRVEGQRTGGGGGGREEQVAENVPLAQAEQSQAVDRKVIKNADLAVESDNPEEAQKRIAAVAESTGGFVVESQQRSSDGRSAARDTVAMTIRVPAAKFGDALAEIRNASGRLISESIKGQDVTEEFIDIEARLKAKKALETQFMEIMKRASSIEDALSVQSQLADVRSEIEKIEGRRRFLENQAGLSTIKVSIQTPAAIAASGAGFFSKLADSVNNGLESATAFVLGLITLLISILPFGLFIGLPGYLDRPLLLEKGKTTANSSRDT